MSEYTQSGRLIVEHEGSTDIEVQGRCVVTNKPYSVTVKSKDYEDWKNGKRIHLAFPYLDAGQREFLISGISPEGWDKTFN